MNQKSVQLEQLEILSQNLREEAKDVMNGIYVEDEKKSRSKKSIAKERSGIAVHMTDFAVQLEDWIEQTRQFYFFRSRKGGEAKSDAKISAVKRNLEAANGAKTPEERRAIAVKAAKARWGK